MIRRMTSRMAFLGLIGFSLCSAVAGDGWFAPAARSSAPPPSRGLFGLPVPRQWTGQPFGQPVTPCANGRCPTPQARNLPSARSSTGIVGDCPTGSCPLPATSGGWTPRPSGSSRPAGPDRPDRPDRADRAGSRSRPEPSDPFRPVTAPLRDAFGSGYDRRELDLRSDYFFGSDVEQSRSRGGLSGRSMEAPVEVSGGTARI